LAKGSIALLNGSHTYGVEKIHIKNPELHRNMEGFHNQEVLYRKLQKVVEGQ
jgi:hypothetical protein